MNLDILKIASDTTNLKNILDFTHKGKSKNPMCGDEIIFMFKLSKNKIVDCGYEGKSCIYCQASASIIAKYLKKKDLETIKKIISEVHLFYTGKNVILNSKLKKIFNKDNLNRKECIYLPIKSLVNALKLKTNQL